MTVKDIDTRFKHKCNNRLVMIESYTTPGQFLTTFNDNLKFMDISGFTKKDMLKNCFIINETDLGDGTYSMTFESIIPNNKIITKLQVNGQDIFRLAPEGSKMKDVENQTFYPLNSQNKESRFNSFKLVNDNKNIYLGFQNNHLKGYNLTDNNDMEILNNVTFKLRTIPHKQMVNFITLVGKPLYGYSNGILGLKDDSDSTYEIIKVDSRQKNKVGLDDVNIYLKNVENGKYLTLMDNDLLGELALVPDGLKNDNIFIIRIKMGYYVLLNYDGTKMLSYDNNKVIFKLHQNVKNSESLLRLRRSFALE